MQPGEGVKAVVSRVEVYGIYLWHGNDTILVLIPEVEWIPTINDCREFTNLGDELDVRILRYVPEKELYMGSIRQVEPEKNPYRDRSLFKVGTRWQAKIRRPIYKDQKHQRVSGYMVEISPGVRAYLPIDLNTDVSTLQRGHEIDVVVASCDKDASRIQVELSGGEDDPVS